MINEQNSDRFNYTFVALWAHSLCLTGSEISHIIITFNTIKWENWARNDLIWFLQQGGGGMVTPLNQPTNFTHTKNATCCSMTIRYSYCRMYNSTIMEECKWYKQILLTEANHTMPGHGIGIVHAPPSSPRPRQAPMKNPKYAHAGDGVTDTVTDTGSRSQTASRRRLS